VAGNANRGRSQELLDLYAEAGAGLTFAIDAYPYAAGSTVLDPISVAQSERVLVSWSRPHPELSGQTLAHIAQTWDCTLLEAMERLQPGGAVYFHMLEADVSRFLGWDRCMVGSDGLPADEHPHPRLWGAFARFLGEYVRERGQFTLQEAVRRMTSLPAAVFGLQDRGRVAPGFWADLVLFDPLTVGARSTYEEPRQAAEGVAWVFVNGGQAWPPQDGPRGTFLRPAPSK
jgi:N-acyl-D-aspartate/D-glutamate deacylase